MLSFSESATAWNSDNAPSSEIVDIVSAIEIIVCHSIHSYEKNSLIKCGYIFT